MTESRTYEQTHPWLRFTIDLRNAPAKFWILLGECQSKCAHIAGTPLEPDTARKLYRLYVARGVLATTAIEGNTLTEEEVLQHLEGKLNLPPSREYLKQEIDNIYGQCIETLEEIRTGGRPELTFERITRLNLSVLNNLTLEQGVVPGEVRKHSVVVARYRGAPPEDCDYLLRKLCDWLNSNTFNSESGLEIVYAIIKAVIAHLYLAWIHPFGDGNGRTARLVEFQILISSGVPAPSAQLLSNHYNQTRNEYYRQLDQASRSGGDVLPFLMYAVQGYVDGLRSQIAEIKNQQLEVAWTNYVHELFKDKTAESDHRKKRLVLDLSKKSEPIEYKELQEISTRIAVAYSKLTEKTLQRDLETLKEMQLIRLTENGGIIANKQIISAFLPIKAT